jgi:hypothetical protein
MNDAQAGARDERMRQTLKTCAHCRAFGYDNDRHCPQCGTYFGPSCGSCGAHVAHPVAFFCVRCGQRLVVDVAPD